MATDGPYCLGASAPSSRFDWVIECLLGALLAFMPFAFGGARPWAEQVVVIVCGAMVVCLGMKLLFQNDSGLVWSWAYVPIGLFLLLAAIQLAPLPGSVLAAVSPNTVALRSNLLGDLPGMEAAADGTTLSFYCPATRRALRLALSVAAVFFVTVNVYRRPAQIKRLLTAIAIVGGAAALLSVAQIITSADKIFWLIPTKGHVLGGPFVNRNNYCQFMNLSVWGVLGLLLIKCAEGFRGTPVAFSSVVKRLGDKDLRPVWYLVGTLVVGTATIFLSLSRGGMISLLAAAGFVALVLAMKRRFGTWGWVMITMALGGMVCVLYVGFDAVYDRMASLQNLNAYQGRWQLAKDTVRASANFPVLGTGLGTHEFVYPMFDQSTVSAKATYAENEYAQLVEETGIVGLLLVVAFGIIVCRSFLRCVRRQNTPIRVGAVGLGAGLLAVAIHSFADFGQHMPANACLSAVFCGLLVSMAKKRSPKQWPGREGGHAAVTSKLAVGVALAGALIVWLWASTGANAARIADGHWRRALQLEREVSRNNWTVTNTDYAQLVSTAEKASRAEPENVLYRHWLNVYRWRSISRVTEHETGNIILGPWALQHTRRVVKDLLEAIALCPTFGPNYSLAGQLEWIVLGNPGGADLIRRGYLLAPCDVTACFAAGLLDASEGKLADSLTKFRRTLLLDGRFFDRIVDVYVRRTQRPEFAVKVARDNAWKLLKVASVLDRGDKGSTLAAQAREQATDLLWDQCERPDASTRALAQLASMCVGKGDYESASTYYGRALAADCSNVHWRLGFARALAQTGRATEAIDQARMCLRLKPGMIEAKRLIADVRVPPRAVPFNE